MRSRPTIAGLLALLAVAVAAAPDVAATSCESSGPVVSVLIVGNSFSKRINRPLRDLLCERGIDAEVRALTPAGAVLGDHLVSKRTRRMLASSDWNYVVFQEQSSGFVGERVEHARALDRLAVEQGAQTLLLMTWLDRSATLDAYGRLLGRPEGVTGYASAASSIGMRIAPVGWAFRQIGVDGNLVDVWGRDDHHASKLGQLLVAKVLAGTILGDFAGAPATSALRVGEAEDAYLASVAEAVSASGPYGWDFRAPNP